MAANERKFKIEYKKGKEDVVESVSATGPGDAIRKLFPKAGEIRLVPAEVIHYNFEVTVEGAVKTIKGEVKQARRSKDGLEEE